MPTFNFNSIKSGEIILIAIAVLAVIVIVHLARKRK